MKQIEFKTIEMAEGKDKFSYRDMLKTFLNSQEWAKNHTLQTVKAIEIEFLVAEAFEDENDVVLVENDAADYFCQLAAELPFLPGATSEGLTVMKDFKVYFEEVKKSDSKKPEDFKKE